VWSSIEEAFQGVQVQQLPGRSTGATGQVLDVEMGPARDAVPADTAHSSTCSVLVSEGSAAGKCCARSSS